MRKMKLGKVAKANAHENEPPMPVRTARGKRTKFTDATVEDAVRTVKAGKMTSPRRR